MFVKNRVLFKYPPIVPSSELPLPMKNYFKSSACMNFAWYINQPKYKPADNILSVILTFIRMMYLFGWLIYCARFRLVYTSVGLFTLEFCT